MLALNAGKNVLCEKPFTVNAKQLEILTKLAKEKKVFLMEAVWTRFFPLSVEVRRLIKEGEIGEVKRVVAELGFNNVIEEEWEDTHRMVNMGWREVRCWIVRFSFFLIGYFLILLLPHFIVFFFYRKIERLTWLFTNLGDNSRLVSPYMGISNALSRIAESNPSKNHRRNA